MRSCDGLAASVLFIFSIVKRLPVYKSDKTTHNNTDSAGSDSDKVFLIGFCQDILNEAFAGDSVNGIFCGGTCGNVYRRSPAITGTW